jgi:hypothetical protein
MRCLSLLLIVLGLPALGQQITQQVLDTDCAGVWKHAVAVFARNGFDPKTADRGTGFATFSYRQGQQASQLTGQINTYTNAGANAFSGYQRFGIENATFTAVDDAGKCKVSAIFDFVGFKYNFLYKGWYKLGSRGVWEGKVLLELEQAIASDPNIKTSSAQAIGNTIKTKTVNKPADDIRTNSGSAATMTFTSDPPGAEVLIDGEYLGSTPTTNLEQKEGTKVIQIKKRGFLVWERKITLKLGDTRTVNADLEPAPQDPSKPRISGLDHQ